MVKNLKFKSIIGLLVYSFIGFFVVFPKQVSASDIALGIYPPIIQIDATAPTNIQSPLTVSNESTTALDVQIIVRPFTQADSDDGRPQYLVRGQKIGEDPHIFDKMSIFDGQKNTDHLTLAPLQKKNLKLLIDLPSGEPSGDYYFSITMLSSPTTSNFTSGTAVAGGVSTNVLLSIGPTDATTGYIQAFSSPLFVDHGPVPFAVHVANTSHHFIDPQGTILIKNMFGQFIGKVDLRQVNILAGTSRFIPDNSPISQSHGGLSTKPVAIWGEKFLLGPYSATVTIALSGEGPIYRRTIYFFALPIQILIGMLLGSILIGVVIYRVKKRLR